MADGAETLQIAGFVPQDQVAVKALVLEGLAERWGVQADPDLDDIAGSYATGTTLVARLNGVLVGTGSVLPREPGVEEVVRLYLAFGFAITHYSDGDFCRDVHLALDLR